MPPNGAGPGPPPGSPGGKTNDQGSCIIHNSIQLRCQTRSGRWRTVMKECPLCCFLEHHALNKSEPKEQQQRHHHHHHQQQQQQQQQEQHGSKSTSRFKETKQDDASSYGSNQAEEVLKLTTRTKDRYQRGAKERLFRPPPPRLEAVASPPPPPPPPKTIMYPPPPRPTHRKVLNETDRHSRHLPSSSAEEKTPVMQEISTSASNLSSEASAFLSHSRSSLSSEATWFGASDNMIPDAKTLQVLQDDEEQQKATRQGRRSCAVALEKKLKDRKEKLRRLRMATRLGQSPTGLDKRSSSPQSVETDHSNETECRSNATGMNHSVAWYADESSSKLEEANERIQSDLPMEAMEAVFDTLLDFGSSTSDDQNAVERVMDCEPGPEAEEYQSRTEKKKNSKKDDNKKKNKKNGVKEMNREEMVRSDDCRTREKRSRRKEEKASSRKTKEDTQERDVWCAPKENSPDSSSKINAENSISGHEFETSNELNERLGYHKLATGQSLSVSDLDSSAEDSSRESQPIWSNKFNGREKKWNPSRRKESRRHIDYEVEAAAAAERGSNREEKELHCSSSLPVESDGETYAAPESEEDSTSHETSESSECHDTLLSVGLKDYEEVFAEAGPSNYVEHDEENAYDEYSYSDDEDGSVPSVIAESDDESYQDSSSRSDGSNISGSSSISDITPFTDASSISMFHRIDHHGRCIYHPYIQLRKKTRVLGKSGLRTEWKVISVNCSECCFEEIVRLRKQNRDTKGIVVGKEGKNHRPRLGSQETVATKSMTSSEPSDSSHDGDDSSFRSDPAGEKYDPSGRTSRPSNFPPPRYPRARDKDDSYNMNRYDSTSTATSKSSSYTGSSGETMSTLSLSFPDTFGEESDSPSRPPKGILRGPSSGRSVCSAKSQKSTVTFAGRDHIVSFCSAIWTIGQDEGNMNIS